jgi:hypothetical protein
MRVNVYAEELTSRIVAVVKTVEGRTLRGVRFMLAFPGQDGRPQWFIHRDGDDDSSAVTFWGEPDQLVARLREAIALLEEKPRSTIGR